MTLITELQRRKVFKVGAAYLVVAWLAVQAASIGFPAFDAPPWALRIFILVTLLGFPLAVVMAWVFDATPEGIKLDTTVSGSKRVIAAASVMVALALGWYLHGRAGVGVAAPGTPTVVVDRNSIAVLPFVNMSSDKEQEYFSDGLSEQLLNQLAQSPELKVIARTSSFSFKGKEVDVATIAKALNVANVLEGSVRKSGNTLRITAQLIRASDSTHLWSQTYDRELTDIFKVQDEISNAIVSALESRIGGSQATTRPALRVNPEAFDDYLHGRALIAKRVGDNTRLAVEAFDRAIAKDPSYSPAHSARAFALTIGSYWGGWMPREQAFAEAQASINEALRLDPGNAEAYMVRGTIETTSLHIVAGKSDLDRALALAPGSVDVINFYGDMLAFTGDLRGAERMKRKAIELDPLAFIHAVNLAQILGAQGRTEESLQYAERGAALGEMVGAKSAQSNLLAAQLRAGRVTDAQRTYDESCAPEVPDRLVRCPALRILLLAAQGRRAEAEHEMAGLVAAERAGQPLLMNGMQGPVGLASLYVRALNDPHLAAAEIRTSLEQLQWFGYNYLLSTQQGQKLPEEIRQDPDWLDVWKDPHIKEWMDAYRVNLAKFRSGG